MGDTTASSVRGAGRKGKERHRRSSRITDATWDSYKPLLCRLWKSYTLAVVMAFMKQRFDFAPSKRQYGYRFKKWKMMKYNSADKMGTPRNSAKIDELPNEDMINDFLKNVVSPDLHVQRYRSRPLFLDVPSGSANYNEAAYHAPSNASGTPAASDVDAEMSFVDEDTDSEDDVSSPGSPAVSIRYPWEVDDEVKKLVADFCAAMSDEENAFDLYSDLLGSLASSSESSASAKNLVIISFARVAQQPKNAKIARELLTRHREQVQQSGSDRPFVFSMLDANMEEQEQKDENLGKDAINRRICESIRKVLVDDTTLGDIPHNYSAIDLVTYDLLSSGLEVYEKTPAVADGPPPTLSLEDLLYQYVYKQPFAETIRYGESSPLRVCITWCARQLQLNHKIPSEVASIPRNNAQGQWCDNVHLFCTLWHAMLMSVQNDTPPPWYGPCESALGISPSELLVTVCWMLGAETKSAPDSRNDILQRANAVAKSMARLEEPELWIKFLGMFTWMNKLVEPDDEDKAFEAVILQHTRRYISATLNVPLPFPADEPHPPSLPFPVDESLPPSLDFFAELDSFTIGSDYGSNIFLDGLGSLYAMEL